MKRRILAFGSALILVLGFAYGQQLQNARSSELEALLAPYAEYLDYCEECFVAALEPMIGRVDYAAIPGR